MRFVRVNWLFTTLSWILLSLLFSLENALAETYSSSCAKTYASSNYDKSYTDYIWAWVLGTNPFPNLSNNCANFASQSIMAGLVGSSSPVKVYDKRNDFLVDQTQTQNWYLRCNEETWGSKTTDCRSLSWGVAGNLKLYANVSNNLFNTKKGLRFRFVTDSTSSTPLAYDKVLVGDIIFADFDRNGITDHTMFVTTKKPLVAKSPSNPTLQEKYSTILLTYQTNNTPDKSLWEIHKYYNQTPVYYVRRPIDYTR